VHVAPFASWLTVNVAPAIVSDPVRLLAELLAPTLKDTGPLPVPDAPLVTVIQLSLLTAVQVHQAAAVTVLFPTPPVDGNDWFAAEIVGAHGPACVTLNTVPAIVSDPSRLHVVVLAATLNVTDPLPDPVAPLVTVIHALLLTAVHGHPAATVTVLLPVLATSGNDWLVGDTNGEHEFPAWLTVKVAPPMVSVPARLEPVLAATANVTEPLPDPDAPPVMEIHDALLDALQPHPVAAVTVLVPVPATAVKDCVVGEIDGEQDAAACVTLKVAPAIVKVPVRVETALFAATLKPTVPLPDPVAPPVTVIQAALLTAVHAQPAATLTLLLPVPADAVKNCPLGEIDGEHDAAACVTVKVAPAIVSVPVRLDATVFTAASKVTEPLPDPVAPLVTVIQGALLAAVQLQPAATVTLLLPLPPVAATDCVVGEIEGEHDAAAWVTVNVAPAIVKVPVRLEATVFAVTLKPTVPLPEPLAPLVTVIQDALLPALQEQPVATVTPLLPVPPAAVNDWVVGEMDGLQPAANCVTVKVVPAIVSVPVRLEATVFAATLNVTGPLPDPVAPPVTVIHAALLAAVQLQPVAAVTALLPLPPAAAKDWVVGEIVGEQDAAACVTVNVAPAMVSVPVRLEATVFAATVKPAVPVPDPAAPLVSVIQDALLAAVHAQPVATLTVLVPVPPDAVNDWLAGEIDGEHDAAACVTVNVVPAIVRVPVRLEATAFAPTLKVTEPLPVPVAPPVIVIHGALLAAVQLHPLATVTVLLPLPAAAVKDWLAGEIDGEQEAAAWVTVKVVPAIVSVPVRLEAIVFAATLKPTVPLPDPLAPLVRVIQAALLPAVHGQPVAIVTLLLPVPPDAVKD
jgi:hypothetical protein